MDGGRKLKEKKGGKEKKVERKKGGRMAKEMRRKGENKEVVEGIEGG
jgi:hypothetical protein